jgi:hypothetical protein
MELISRKVQSSKVITEYRNLDFNYINVYNLEVFVFVLQMFNVSYIS